MNLPPLVPKIVKKNKLSPEERKALDRVRYPRKKGLNLKFWHPDVEAWKADAEAAGLSLTEWIEETLNRRAGRTRE